MIRQSSGRQVVIFGGLGLWLWVYSLGSYAQQKPQFTQYIYTNYLLNPALTGIEDYTDLKLGFRNQWTGIDGAPKTFFFTAQTPLGNKNTHQSATTLAHSPEGNSRQELDEQMSAHHGLGLIGTGDRAGPFTQFTLDVTYAYHLPLSRSVSLAAGFAAGLYQFGVSAGAVSFPVPGPIDPAIKSGTVVFPDLSMGLWLYSQQGFFGTSIGNIIPYSLSLQPGGSGQASRSSRNYFITAGYRIYLSNEISVLPSLLLKYIRPEAVSVDFNAKLSYQDRFWLGVSVRKGDSFSVLAGLNVNSLFNIGYSYDYTTSALQTIAGGTHEIILGLLLNNSNRRLCPRNVW